MAATPPALSFLHCPAETRPDDPAQAYQWRDPPASAASVLLSVRSHTEGTYRAQARGPAASLVGASFAFTPLAVARSYTDDRAAILFVRVGFTIEGGDFSRLLCKPRCRKCGDHAECDECKSIDLPKMLADAFDKPLHVWQLWLQPFTPTNMPELLQQDLGHLHRLQLREMMVLDETPQSIYSMCAGGEPPSCLLSIRIFVVGGTAPHAEVRVEPRVWHGWPLHAPGIGTQCSSLIVGGRRVTTTSESITETMKAGDVLVATSQSAGCALASHLTGPHWRKDLKRAAPEV